MSAGKEEIRKNDLLLRFNISKILKLTIQITNKTVQIPSRDKKYVHQLIGLRGVLRQNRQSDGTTWTMGLHNHSEYQEQ